MTNSTAFPSFSCVPAFLIHNEGIAIPHAVSEISSRVRNFVSKAIVPESQPAASLLQAKNIVVLPDAFNKFFDKCMAGGWGILVGMGVLSLLSNIGDLRQAIALDRSDPQKTQKVVACAKKVFIDSTFIGGVVANTLEWAHSVNWISLGRLAPVFKIAGFGASVVIAGIGIADAIKDIHVAQRGVDAAPTEDLKEKEREKRRLGLLNLIWNVSTVAWGVLGCVAIACGVAISPLITSGLLAVGFAAWVLAYVYRTHKGLNADSCSSSVPAT